MEEICDDFKSSHPPVEGALLPAEYGAILRDGGESALYHFFLQSFVYKIVLSIHILFIWKYICLDRFSDSDSALIMPPMASLLEPSTESGLNL